MNKFLFLLLLTILVVLVGLSIVFFWKKSAAKRQPTIEKDSNAPEAKRLSILHVLRKRDELPQWSTTFLLLFLIISLFVTGLAIIPYWTGIEAEQQLTHFNELFYPEVNLKPVKTTYERGWFSSRAQTTVETLDVSYSDSGKQRFLLVYEIDHGLVPIQSTLVHTTLHTVTDKGKNLNKDSVGKELLEVRSAVQLNGDSVSTLRMPTLTLKDDHVHLQWQGLEGSVFLKHNFAAMQSEIYSPQLQLKTEQGKIVIQGITLKVEVQPTENNVMQGEGSLSIADVLLVGKKAVPVKLVGIKLVGNNQIVNDNLEILVKTGLQQIQVGNDRYGPGYGNFELQRWHVPTLTRLKNTLTQMRGQGLPLLQEAYMAKTKLMPYGLALLKNAPEFAVTRLSFNMPEGELRGKLRVKMELFEGIFFAAFNPFLLLNILNAQLEMHIPQSLLYHVIQTPSSTIPTTPKTLEQYLKLWLDQGILVPTKDQPDYYQSQMHLKKGILQVNGQQVPLASIWKKKN